MSFLTPSELRLFEERPELSYAWDVKKEKELNQIIGAQVEWRLRLAGRPTSMSGEKGYPTRKGHSGLFNAEIVSRASDLLYAHGENPRDRDFELQEQKSKRLLTMSEIFLAWRSDSCRFRQMERKKLIREKRTMMKLLKRARKRTILYHQIHAWISFVSRSCHNRTLLKRAKIKLTARSENVVLNALQSHASKRVLRRRSSRLFSTRLLQRTFRFLILRLGTKKDRAHRLMRVRNSLMFLVTGLRRTMMIWSAYHKNRIHLKKSLSTLRTSVLRKWFLSLYSFADQSRRANLLRLRVSVRHRQSALNAALDTWADSRAAAGLSKSTFVQARVRRASRLLSVHFAALRGFWFDARRLRHGCQALRSRLRRVRSAASLAAWCDRAIRRRSLARLSRSVSSRTGRAQLAAAARAIFGRFRLAAMRARVCVRRALARGAAALRRCHETDLGRERDSDISNHVGWPG